MDSVVAHGSAIVNEKSPFVHRKHTEESSTRMLWEETTGL
jgi:hypothetical protein